MPDLIELTDNERQALAIAAEEALARGDHAARRRMLAVLLLGKGLDALDVSIELDCAESSVTRWAARYRQEGIAGLATKQRPEHYERSPRQQRKLDRIRELREKGLSWGGIALVMGFRTAAGPWRLWHRHYPEEESEQ